MCGHVCTGRLLTLHGGTMAGCSFAEDVLEPFLLPIASASRLGQLRNYVDDITLRRTPLVRSPPPCAPTSNR